MKYYRTDNTPSAQLTALSLTSLLDRARAERSVGNLEIRRNNPPVKTLVKLPLTTSIRMTRKCGKYVSFGWIF